MKLTLREKGKLLVAIAAIVARKRLEWSDLLVINKTDLASYVRADLGIMKRDSRKMRGNKPFVFTNIRAGEGAEVVIRFIREWGGF